MVIQEIIAIAGKPGLYRIIKTNRANLVVESMLDRKRVSIPGTSRISSLADITMYTTGEDALLMDILNTMFEKGDNVKAPESNSSPQVVRDFADSLVPNLDHERVYNSDLKKLVQWFSILRKNEAFPLINEAKTEDSDEDVAAKKGAEVAEAADEKGTGKKATKKPAAKKASVKKPATTKKAVASKTELKGKPAAKKAAIKKSTGKSSKAK